MIKNIVRGICMILSIGILASCCSAASRPAYRELYAHLDTKVCPCRQMNEPQTEFFVVLLVEARHLDYTDNRSLLRTLVKHPSDGSKNGDVGHAWVCLRGVIDGEPIEIEGGHSGERGIMQAKYFEGVMNNIDYGCANPLPEQIKHPCCEPNPIKYLWATQKDGFFQRGRGRHYPTFAAKIDITEDQFWEIISFMDPGSYNYSDYAITRNQCSSFVSQIAAIAGVFIACEVTIPVQQKISLGGNVLTLWNDPCYSSLTFSSPDIVERSLMQAVRQGKAECALDWYKRTHPRRCSDRLCEWGESIVRFPSRAARVLYFR